MNFSDLIPHSGGIACFQPGQGDLCAVAKDFEVTVYDPTSTVIAKYAFMDQVTGVEWSPDGHFLLV